MRVNKKKVSDLEENDIFTEEGSEEVIFDEDFSEEQRVMDELGLDEDDD